MAQFAEVFSDMEIVVTLSRQLSWSHFVAILPLKDNLQRDFYAISDIVLTGSVSLSNMATPVLSGAL